ncbi:HIT family protein [Massilia arenosa]|uniref:HIT family protein n=1 Tax=Zemynaea arenosa TaxID=2561931 RepID=A0A4Y9S9D9_9BURK|nr:HIT family protein [Massilia arenosa]TFW18380.1 HIT family protein [Massilia arenosa]
MTIDTAHLNTCDLCALQGAPVWRGAKFSVIAVEEPNYPGFCRVVWHTHVKEMTDLALADRTLFMNAVWEVEAAVRAVFEPQKVNLASLGNMTPHLHWHVIPRFPDDAHWPNPVWAAVSRATDASTLAARRAAVPRLHAAIAARLEALA